MNPRLTAAIAVFLVLGILAWVLLEGAFRYAVLFLLAALALKTLIAHKAGW